MIKLLAVSAALSLAAGAASAQGAFDWNGLYGGASFGVGMSDVYITYTNPNFTSSPDGSGGIVGVQVGYNWALTNKLIVGLEADAAVSSVDGGSTLSNGNEFWPFSLNKSAAVRARLGYKLKDTSMVYAAVGAARGHVSGDIYNDAAATNYRSSYGGWQNGWVVGVGYEMVLGERTTLWTELRHTDLGATPYVPPGTIPIEVNFSSTDLRFGVNFHF